MHGDPTAGSWKHFSGRIQECWAARIRADLEVLRGERVRLEGRLQGLHGILRDGSRKRIEEFARKR